MKDHFGLIEKQYFNITIERCWPFCSHHVGLHETAQNSITSGAHISRKLICLQHEKYGNVAVQTQTRVTVVLQYKHSPCITTGLLCIVPEASTICESLHLHLPLGAF